MFLEPLVAAILGGIIGGVATGITVILILRAKGQAWFIDPQVDYLEKKLREVVVEQAFGQLARLLDRGERWGQLATRVLEIVHLLRGGKLEPPAAAPGAPGVADIPLSAAHAAMGTALAALGRPSDAQREFEQALRLDPSSAAARQGLAALALAPPSPASPAQSAASTPAAP